MIDVLKPFFQLFFGMTGFATAFLLALLGSDGLLRKKKSEYYSALLKANFTNAGQSLYVVDLFFGPDRPARAFLGTMCWLTALGLLGAVFQYVLWVPGFWSSLMQDDFARRVFLRQVLTTGLPIVLIVNLGAGMVYAAQRRDRPRRSRGLNYLLFDLITRFGLFVAMMVVTYAGSAALFGAFGGDSRVAMQAVLPTLAMALQFENLTAAYLLAALLGGVPVFAAAALDLMERLPPFGQAVRVLFDHLPLGDKPVLTSGVVFAIFSYLSFQIAALILSNWV